jgi:hypothetical protein
MDMLNLSRLCMVPTLLNTELSYGFILEFRLEIDPCLGITFDAMHSDWKTGDHRVLKRWPSVNSEGS